MAWLTSVRTHDGTLGFNLADAFCTRSQLQAQLQAQLQLDVAAAAYVLLCQSPIPHAAIGCYSCSKMHDTMRDLQDMHLLAERHILSGLKAGGWLKGGVEEMLEQRVAALFMPHGTPCTTNNHDGSPTTVALVVQAMMIVQSADLS